MFTLLFVVYGAAQDSSLLVQRRPNRWGDRGALRYLEALHLQTSLYPGECRLIASERRGQFIHYRLVRDNLVNTLNGYIQEVCPVSRPLKRESARLAKGKS